MIRESKDRVGVRIDRREGDTKAAGDDFGRRWHSPSSRSLGAERLAGKLKFEAGDPENARFLGALISGGTTDPSGAMNVLKSSGFTHQWFPRQPSPSTPWEARMDYLMDDQNSTMDLNQRKKDFDEVQEIMADEMPLIFTVSPQFYCAMRSNIGNVRATALSDYPATWNIEELYFKK